MWREVCPLVRRLVESIRPVNWALTGCQQGAVLLPRITEAELPLLSQPLALTTPRKTKLLPYLSDLFKNILPTCHRAPTTLHSPRKVLAGCKIIKFYLRFLQYHRLPECCCHHLFLKMDQRCCKSDDEIAVPLSGICKPHVNAN